MVDFLHRLRLCWRFLWYRELLPAQPINPLALQYTPVTVPTYINPNYGVISALVASPLSTAVRRAVEKVHKDPSFHKTKDHLLKHKEALSWVSYYSDGHVPAWEAGFLLEWWVGVLKGKLV